MGGKISREEMKELRKGTRGKLDQKEIQKYHKFWYDLYPSGEMGKEGFIKFAQLALPNWDGHSDVDYLFRAMDSNNDGTVTFKEFLLFQSITAPSSEPLNPMELIDLAFDMYDEDRDGFVTVDEMRESLFNMFKAKGMNVNDPNVKNQIEHRITNLLSVADKNNDGKLTREEIFSACEKDPQIVAMF